MRSSEAPAGLFDPHPRRPGILADRDMASYDVTLPSPAEDLALDEAMLIEADEGRGSPAVRFWEPRDYAVILGASCRLGNDVQLDACRADGVPILRRSSGGGTVVIGPGTLNVSVILPETAAPGSRPSTSPSITSSIESPSRFDASADRSPSWATATWPSSTGSAAAARNGD